MEKNSTIYVVIRSQRKKLGRVEKQSGKQWFDAGKMRPIIKSWRKKSVRSQEEVVKTGVWIALMYLIIFSMWLRSFHWI